MEPEGPSILVGQAVAWLKVVSVALVIISAIGLLVRFIERRGRRSGDRGK
jgi:ABC-type nickel/cobalt efflux system permease component RcnA